MALRPASAASWKRADKTSRMLDVKYFLLLPAVSDVGTPLDDLQWSALLRSGERPRGVPEAVRRISPKRVAEFLLLDRYFPLFHPHCLLERRTRSGSCRIRPWGTSPTLPSSALGRLTSSFNYAAVSEIIAAGLHQFLDSFQRDLNEVGDAIFATFFARRPDFDPGAASGKIQAAAAQSQS